MLKKLRGLKRKREESPDTVQTPEPTATTALFAFPDVFTVKGCDGALPCAVDTVETSGEERFDSLKLKRRHAQTLSDVEEYLNLLVAFAEESGFMDKHYEEDCSDSDFLLRTRVLDAISLCAIQDLPAGVHSAATYQKPLGYLYRLSDEVLRYPLKDTAALKFKKADAEKVQEYVVCYDNTLPASLYQRLAHCFRKDAPFWKEHHYVVGKTPYFSYRHPLHSNVADCKGSLIDTVAVFVAKLMAKEIPGAAKAKYVEWWAHSRPHVDAHQLHVDADNEGKGGVRNPLANCIIFLSEGTGGPTLVTTQRHGDTKLSQEGWFVHPKENRIVAYPANVLHGVLPGRGCEVSPDARRVTLMIALWGEKGCSLRPSATPNASRPYPQKTASGAYRTKLDTTEYSWPKEFTCTPSADWTHDTQDQKVLPPSVTPLWDDVCKKPSKKRKSVHTLKRIPHYDVCYQGF